MKLLLENWRMYLTEEVKYSGILMIKPTPELISEAKQIMSKVDLPPEAVVLKDAALHITLVHQSLLKPYKKQLKNMSFPPEPKVILANDVKPYFNEAQGRKSWVIEVENQDDLRDYTRKVMEMIGGDPNPDPSRTYHMTMANLVGEAGGTQT